MKKILVVVIAFILVLSFAKEVVANDRGILGALGIIAGTAIVLDTIAQRSAYDREQTIVYQQPDVYRQQGYYRQSVGYPQTYRQPVLYYDTNPRIVHISPVYYRHIPRNVYYYYPTNRGVRIIRVGTPRY